MVYVGVVIIVGGVSSWTLMVCFTGGVGMYGYVYFHLHTLTHDRCGQDITLF